MSKRLLLTPCALIALAFALAACGSGSDETGEIEAVIAKSATSNDPANCKRLNTQRFNEQLAGESGAGALEECEEEAEKEEGLDSVRVSEVEVDGDGASAEVALSGGGFDGQSVEVALVKNDEQWKMDEIVKFTKFDSDQLANAFESEVAAHPGEINRQLAACLGEGFAKASRGEAEELLLSGSRKALEELAEGCSSSSGA